MSEREQFRSGGFIPGPPIKFRLLPGEEIIPAESCLGRKHGEECRWSRCKCSCHEDPYPAAVPPESPEESN